MKFAAIFKYSMQVGPDSWAIMQAVKECTPETTVAEIYQWQKEQIVSSSISLTIEVMQ